MGIIPAGVRVPAPGTIIRLPFPSRVLWPDIGTRRGTVVLEPVDTPGVVCAQWDGRTGVVWHKAGDLTCE